MDRRNFLKTAAVSAVTYGTLTENSNAAKIEKRVPDFNDFKGKTRGGKPDVLVIFTDQWNPRCAGFNGNPDIKTPFSDAIVKNGVNFSNCYSPSPICMPARCSLISGLYPHNHHLWSNNTNFYMDPDISGMFRDIKKAGYFTAQVGKLHWIGGKKWQDRFKTIEDYYRALGIDYAESISSPFSVTDKEGKDPYIVHLRKLGLLEEYAKDMKDRLLHDSYIPKPSIVKPEDHNDSFITDRGIKFLQSIPENVPYCMFVSMPGPHPPLDAPGKYSQMYDPDKLKFSPNIQMNYKYSGGTADEKTLRAMTANYYGKISLIDDNIGKIVNAVKKRGNFDNTLIMVISDHGEMLGAHGCMSKVLFWEESVRVPMIMQWPAKIKPDQTLNSPVSLMDVYATIVDAVEGKASQDQFSKSMLPMAMGKVKKNRDAVFSEVSHGQNINYMVRADEYKWFLQDGKEYLFDMEKDPFELKNLIDDAKSKPVIDNIKNYHLAFFRQTQLNISRNYIPKARRVKMEAKGEIVPSE
jgi:arylsulfatase A-like enzyme